MRLVVRASLLALSLLLATTQGASADNCSNARDTRACRAAIDATAAVAALAAAAAAAGWIPKPRGEGGKELSQECREALEALAARIRDLYQQMAELTIAQRGAYQSWADALVDREEAGEQAGAVLRAAQGGNYDWKGVMDATMSQGNPATGAGIGTSTGELIGARARAAAEMARASAIAGAAQMKQQANVIQSLSRFQQQSADALSRAAAMGGREPFQGAAQMEQARLARMANIQRIRAAELARQARQAGTAATTQVITDSRWVTGLKYAGKGLGVYSTLTSAWGMYQAGNRADALRIAGILQARSQEAAAEAARRRAQLDELQQWENDVRMAMSQAIADYDARAALCGAELISQDAFSGLMKGFTEDESQLREPSPVGWENLPAVVGQPPKPVDPNEAFQANCETYLNDLAAYERELNEVNELFSPQAPSAFEAQPRPQTAAAGRWEERLADLDATIPKMEQALASAEAGYLSEARRQTTTGVISAGASIAALVSVVTPPVAIALGILSLTSGLISGSATPDEANLIYIGRLAQELEQLRQKRAYAQTQVAREQQARDTRRGNLQVRFQQLNVTYNLCQGSERGWSAPAAPPQQQPSGPRFAGSVRTLQEIGAWQ